MLRADNLSVRRGPCTVLADIDLQLQPGQVLGVLGPVLPRAWRINPAGNIAAALVEAALVPTPGVRIVGSADLAER